MNSLMYFLRQHRRSTGLGLLCSLALVLAACGSVMADGMVEQPPGAKPGIQSSRGVSTAGKTPPVQRSARRGNTTPLSPFELAKYQYCGQDSDCVGAINGCCDCANGGQEIALNKDRLEAFRKNFECLQFACGDKSPETPCFSGVVSCVEHRCKYFTQDDFEK